MPTDIEFTMDTSQLEKALQRLPAKVAQRYAKQAMQAAGDIVLASMKQLAPERTDEPTPDESSLPPGILKEDLTTQVTVSNSGTARVKIGPTAIAAHVARWQENGWVLTSHDGKKIRHIPGKHFMSAAFDETAQQAVDTLVASLSESLNMNDESEDTL